MDASVYVILLVTTAMAARMFCDRTKLPLEIGEWTTDLHHMDSATIENPPVTSKEGQVYVYENYFPNQIIKYIHVENLARRSCGASASIKAGGNNSPGVLIVLESAPYQEIRSVIEIWGRQLPGQSRSHHSISPDLPNTLDYLRTFYMNQMRAVNHNHHNNTPTKKPKKRGGRYN